MYEQELVLGGNPYMTMPWTIPVIIHSHPSLLWNTAGVPFSLLVRFPREQGFVIHPVLVYPDPEKMDRWLLRQSIQTYNERCGVERTRLLATQPYDIGMVFFPSPLPDQVTTDVMTKLVERTCDVVPGTHRCRHRRQTHDEWKYGASLI